jgi:signal transduction histidine kinase
MGARNPGHPLTNLTMLQPGGIAAGGFLIGLCVGLFARRWRRFASSRAAAELPADFGVDGASGGADAPRATPAEVGERIRQAQKLEAVGLLAGGVAHDFNNLLTVVNGCTEVLLQDLPGGSPERALVEEIGRAAERGTTLTRQLLAFGRQQVLHPEIVDPAHAVAETVRLLSRLLGEDVVITTRVDPRAGHVRTDRGQFEQILMNLAVNARDAMPRGGTLAIEVGRVEVGPGDLPSPDASPGAFVRLTVRDTGHGMPPEVQVRVFEPFFTTKGPGSGTGLGLATVYGIVVQSGGFITLESEVGRGTAFHVHLPWQQAAPAPAVPAASAAPVPMRPRRHAGGETILVVEDDKAVRGLTTRVLERQGYTVISADGASAALAACEALPRPPDLVLTDVVMPGTSGRGLAETLARRYPGLKVVFLSGYTADAVLRHGIAQDRVAFLAKPYTAESLGRFVRDVLDGAR